MRTLFGEIILFIFIGSQLRAQENHFDALGASADFSLYQVKAIAQDKKGFLWFGGQNGLYRYDGYNFTPFLHDDADEGSLSDNNIYSIYFDNAGTEWIGTGNGLNRYDTASHSFHHYLLESDKSQGQNGHNISCIAEDAFSRIWVATTDGGIYVFSKNNSGDYSATHIAADTSDSNGLSSNFAYCILFDHHSRGWIGTAAGICLFDCTKNIPSKIHFTHLHHDGNNIHSLSGEYVWKINEDAGGHLWICTLQGTVDFLANEQSRTFQHVNFDGQNSAAASANIVSDCFADNENLWVTTSPGGLWRLKTEIINDSLHIIKRFNYENETGNAASLVNNSTWKIFSDRSGITWIGTDKGISKYTPQREKFDCLHFASLYPEITGQNVNAIFADSEKNIWIGGAYNHIWKINDGRITQINLNTLSAAQEMLQDNFVNSIFRSENGNLFVATHAGLFVLRDEDILAGKKGPDFLFFSTSSEEKSRLENNVCIQLTPWDNNHLLIGTGNGVDEINETDFSVSHLVTDAEIPNQNIIIRTLTVDRNHSIWLGTDDGLIRYNRINHTYTIYKNTAHDTSSICNSRVQYVFADHENNIWTGTASGLSCLSTTSGKFKSYYKKNGLCGEDISAITEDAHDNLWITTSSGLSEFNPHTQQFRNFDTQDGMNAINCMQLAIFRTSDHAILFGSENGVNSFYPQSFSTDSSALPVYFTDFSIFSKSILDGGFASLKNAFEKTAPLVLHYDQNFFTISFVALNFLNPAKTQYRYRLDGIDKNWVSGKTQRSANYTSIPPGHYLFHVSAANDEGIWSNQNISIPIIIQSPWWQTWWFYLLCLLTLASILFALYKYRVAQIIKMERMRNRISRDLHDQVGSTLGSISFYSELAKNMTDRNEAKLKDLLERIENSSRSTVETMSDIVWAINPVNDSFDKLISRMQNVASELLNPKNITVLFKIDEGIEQEMKLNIEERKNLFLIFKEAVYNAAKYSLCKNITISLKRNGRYLSLKIEDDGKGIDEKETPVNGNGMRTMRERTEELKGKFLIQSSIGKGTMVHVEIPFR